ncbi:hypothetical protein Tco_0910446 [Tanacetum coccineum]|uniref:Uncharacterized protein n=1 Tax=Tanacetum coccineum TaxID=301880 RepID=A0ABQ5CSV7_9ASTR
MVKDWPMDWLELYLILNQVTVLDFSMNKDSVVWIEESKQVKYSVSAAWRNKRIFKDKARKSEELIKDIQRHMVMLVSLIVKNSRAVVKDAKMWDLAIEKDMVVSIT